jgi:hypothetical protein
MAGYAVWAASFQSDLPALTHLLQSLPYLSLKQRKAILTLSRVQPSTLSWSSRYCREYRTELRANIVYKLFVDQRETFEQNTLYGLISALHPVFTSTIYSLLSVASRMAPYQDYSDIVSTQRDTIEKEIQAATSYNPPPKLNYTAIFSSFRRDRLFRIYPNVPLEEDLHRKLHQSFQRSKFLLHGRLIYPRVSNKTIGVEAQEISSRMVHHNHHQECSVDFVESVADVERVYHETGVELKGPVEMRKAWKYNDLKPRVYYAQGPDVFHRSKYIQSIFNVILDCFQVVHRKNRYELPEDRRMSDSDALIIYDYSSFTSRLDEVLEFTRALADFYTDVQVVLVDSHLGLKTVSLRDLLLEYTSACNESSVFDAARVLGLESFFPIFHTCGMLGVPGNISSCTLLHGIHLSVLLSSDIRGRCVGDDALACLPEADEETLENFMDGVNNLGMVEKEKFSIWSYEDDQDESEWHYLKRPITRISSAIQLGIAYIWPSIANLLNLSDDFHTVVPVGNMQRRKTFIAQWSRLLDRMHHLQTGTLSDLDIAILVHFQNGAYRRLDLRNGGLLRFGDVASSSLICPRRMTKDGFDLDWRHITYDHFRKFGGVSELPASWELSQKFEGFLGEELLSTTNALYGLLEKLGYLEKEIAMEIVDFRTMTFEECRIYLDLDYAFTYRFTVVKDFPIWYQHLQYVIPMSPHERLSTIEQWMDVGE